MNRRSENSAAADLVRPLVQKLHGYVPGEQPKIKGLVKLNTNENPYPPSPKVMAAIRDGVDERLRLYPPPTSQRLREKLARFHKCSAAQIVVGNGSDDLLALATRAFVEPATPALRPRSRHRATIQYFSPSYSLYPVLSAIQGSLANAVALEPDFGLPPLAKLKKKGWDFRAALTFITTPNAPSGRGYDTADLDDICEVQQGVVILDEAYVDFAEQNALELALRHPHVLIARTFSKAYSLCFLRVGYFVGHPALIAAIDKVRDSYNVNGLGQIAAERTLDDLSYYRANFRRIVATRARLSAALTERGFEVAPSRTNFILVRPPRFSAEIWLGRLREQKILVRWFNSPPVREYLRITIGSDSEIDALLKAVDRVR